MDESIEERISKLENDTNRVLKNQDEILEFLKKYAGRTDDNFTIVHSAIKDVNQNLLNLSGETSDSFDIVNETLNKINTVTGFEGLFSNTINLNKNNKGDA